MHPDAVSSDAPVREFFLAALLGGGRPAEPRAVNGRANLNRNPGGLHRQRSRERSLMLSMAFFRVATGSGWSSFLDALEVP